ncbi:MBL fold metallo-hydrolase [bacterium]|nr:MBL fold metallo-hydrolase [bacterium]
MKVLSLASGSGGNCIYIEEDGQGLLIDAGISRRRIVNLLKHHRIPIENIQAVLLTHEHYDHIKGLGVLTKYHRYPVYATPGTAFRVMRRFMNVEVQPFYFNLILDGFNISAIPLPHDAAEPVGYIVETCRKKMMIATDMGYAPDSLMEAIPFCDAVMIESNHDVEMLMNGSYPDDLKQRILSQYGHLSNAQCAAALRNNLTDKTKLVILAHLSGENNHPEIALRENSLALRNGIKLVAASRDIPTGPFMF